MAKISEDCQTHEILASPFVCDRILSHLAILQVWVFYFGTCYPHGPLIILGLQAGFNWLSLLHKLSLWMFTVNLINKIECANKKKR